MGPNPLCRDVRVARAQMRVGRADGPIPTAMPRAPAKNISDKKKCCQRLIRIGNRYYETPDSGGSKYFSSLRP